MDRKEEPTANIVPNTQDPQENVSPPKNNSSEVRRFILPITAITVLSIGLGAAFYLSQQTQDTRNYAVESQKAIIPSKVQLILYLKKDPTTGQINVESANAYQTSFSPYTPPNAFPETDTTILEQVINGSVVSSIPFRFNEYAYSLPPRPGEAQYGDAPFKLEKPEAVLSIPFNTNSQFRLRRNNPQESESAQSLDMTKVRSSLSNIKTIHAITQELAQEGASAISGNDGYLDILYIASHYGENTSQFLSDVSAMGSFLKTVVPYKEMASKIRIQTYPNTAELGCHYSGRCIICNSTAVMNAAAAAGTPYDTVMVVENNNTYGGCAYFGGFAATYRDINDDARQVAVHEMSHSLIRLADEYDYGSQSNGAVEDFVNCDDNVSCRDWGGTEQINCFPACSYSDWKKPTNKNCIMETLWNPNGFHYDFVDTPEVRRVIQTYATGGTNPSPTPNVSGCFSYTGPPEVQSGKYIRYAISLNGKTLSAYSSFGACSQATAGSGDPAGCDPSTDNKNCCFVGQTGTSCGGHVQATNVDGTCAVRATRSDGQDCSLSVTVVKPTSTPNPTPSPWIQVKIQNQQGNPVIVNKISRADCTSSPCTQSQGISNVSSATFPGGPNNSGAKVTSPGFTIIGVTPIPDGKYFPDCKGGNDGRISCYTWPKWSTGKHAVTFVVSNLIPTSIPPMSPSPTPH